MPRLVWTKELIEYLKKHYDDLSYKKLSEIMNNSFNIKTTPSSIEHKVNRLGLKKSEEGLNKSRNLKAASLFWFQKGHIPYSKKPIGYERIDPNGYIWIKVANPNVFKAKHRVVWEKAHGKIPKSHCILFMDGNSQNCNLDNLQLISRGELAVINKMGIQRNDADLTKTLLVLSRLIIKTSERERSIKNAKK